MPIRSFLNRHFPPVQSSGSSSEQRQPAGESSSSGRQFAKLKKTARRAYEDNRLYHGTQQSSKNAIRQRGFSKSIKCEGAAAAVSGDDVDPNDGFAKNAREHHFFMKKKKDAQAMGRNYFDRPALVRTFKNGVHFEQDPDFPSNTGAIRTAQDIPAGNVLGAKRSPPSAEEKRAMQAILARARVSVNSEEAGRLLRAVQSDSEEDF